MSKRGLTVLAMFLLAIANSVMTNECWSIGMLLSWTWFCWFVCLFSSPHAVFCWFCSWSAQTVGSCPTGSTSQNRLVENLVRQTELWE